MMRRLGIVIVFLVGVLVGTVVVGRADASPMGPDEGYTDRDGNRCELFYGAWPDWNQATMAKGVCRHPVNGRLQYVIYLQSDPGVGVMFIDQLYPNGAWRGHQVPIGTHPSRI